MSLQNRLAVFVFAAPLSVLIGASYGHAATHSFGGGAVSIEFVTVGDAGNPAVNPPLTVMRGQNQDIKQGTGSVDYVYEIGKYEVSVNQASAAAGAGAVDLTGLTSWSGDQPLSVKNWYYAAEFVNWLNENADDGPYPAAYQNVNTGGNGSATPWALGDVGYDPANPFRNSRAKYSLPSLDEWLKAAYYDPTKDGGAGGYWTYAQQSDTEPTSTTGGTAAGTAVFRPDGEAALSGPADVDNAGAASYYGTVAQEGNLFEWGGEQTNLVNNGPLNGNTFMNNHGPSYDVNPSLLAGANPPFPSFLGINGTWADKGKGDGSGNNIGFRAVALEPYDVILPTGDYNADGVVDTADFALWRNHLGETFELLNEDPSQTPGEVTMEDYEVWRANYGMVSTRTPVGELISAAASAPEPSSLMLVFGLAGMLLPRRRG